jgi:hypothetical protein
MLITRNCFNSPIDSGSAVIRFPLIRNSSRFDNSHIESGNAVIRVLATSMTRNCFSSPTDSGNCVKLLSDKSNTCNVVAIDKTHSGHVVNLLQGNSNSQTLSRCAYRMSVTFNLGAYFFTHSRLVSSTCTVHPCTCDWNGHTRLCMFWQLSSCLEGMVRIGSCRESCLGSS